MYEMQGPHAGPHIPLTCRFLGEPASALTLLLTARTRALTGCPDLATALELPLGAPAVRW